MKTDKACLVLAPEVHISDHLLLFFGCALYELGPETDNTPDAMRLAIFEALRIIGFA
ncbi:MAG TPA: hypothetical protein VEK32_22045 [Thermodesulfobacteriota bacterium]|nr:hypothetical protein [Thermodesulfobacteriota bacterium]